MSKLMEKWFEDNAFRREPGPVALRKKIVMVDLIRPSGFGIHNLHSAIALEVLRWMVRTGLKYQRDQHRPGVIASLDGRSTCIFGGLMYFPLGFSGPDWLDKLRAMFLRALLDPFASGIVEEWRREERVLIGESRVLPIRWRKPMWAGDIGETDFRKILTDCLTMRGRTRKSHNSVHKKATWVHAISLMPYPSGWECRLTYGYRKDSSSWTIDVTTQRKDELFTDFVLRLQWNLNRLVLATEAPDA